jgi:hypothetical protein
MHIDYIFLMFLLFAGNVTIAGPLSSGSAPSATWILNL